MKCEIMCYAVPLPGQPLTACGTMTTQCQCMTHGTIMPPFSSSDSPCPVGRVEQAVEEGLAKIAAALTLKSGA